MRDSTALMTPVRPGNRGRFDMDRKAIAAFLTAAAILGPASNPARPSEADALTVRVVRPDVQAERVIALFRGNRAPHPAAALSAWKHATGGKGSLGKPLEAAIAALNPAMVPELRHLHGTEFAVGFEPVAGRPWWWATLPDDDGSFAAVASALSLTDGASDQALGDLAVLRLGPPGSALSAPCADRLVFASTRAGLQTALDRPAPPAASRDGAPAGTPGSTPPGFRRSPPFRLDDWPRHSRRPAAATPRVGHSRRRDPLARPDGPPRTRPAWVGEARPVLA